jgi:hypothetical protein
LGAAQVTHTRRNQHMPALLSTQVNTRRRKMHAKLEPLLQQGARTIPAQEGTEAGTSLSALETPAPLQQGACAHVKPH